VGFIGYTPKQLRNMVNTGKLVGVYDGLVYDLTSFITNAGVGHPANQQVPATDTTFMALEALDVFKFSSGLDVTKQLNSLNIDQDAHMRHCLQNLFTIGKVDN
jgi:chitin synthase